MEGECKDFEIKCYLVYIFLVCLLFSKFSTFYFKMEGEEDVSGKKIELNKIFYSIKCIH